MLRHALIPVLVLLFSLPLALYGEETAKREFTPADKAKSANHNYACIECHRERSPGLYAEWVQGPHASAGVGCLDCHGADRREQDSFKHFGRIPIGTVVTPNDCARCHKTILRDFFLDGHSQSLRMLRNMPEDDPRYPLIEPYKESDFAECAGCHGSEIRLADDRRPAVGTWPNSGAGRINPDGKPGACSSCHKGHRFSAARARRPQACLGCHDGKNYPEGSIYLHSPHGLIFDDLVAGQPLDLPSHFLDSSRFAAPSCALCHMNGAAPGLATEHNLAARLPRELTEPAAAERNAPDERRGRMVSVCRQCHEETTVERIFAASDARLAAYQAEVVEPALADYRKRLDKAKGDKRSALLREYGAFLTEAKRYRMNLYMGQHGRSERP